MNLLKKVIGKIYRVTIYKSVNLARGRKLATIYCNNPNDLYIITSHGLGDVVWMSVYLGAYLKKNNIKQDKVVIVTERKLSDIIDEFIPGLRYQFIQRKELIILQQYYSIYNNVNNVKLAVFPLVRMDKIGDIEFDVLSCSGAEMDSLYRIGAFGLDRKTESYPIINKKTASKGRIIFVPFVNSRNVIPVQIWERIVDIAKKTDRELLTNVGPNEKPIKGTTALTLGLKELVEDITEEDLVIGGRCGLIDWLFVAQKNIIILHSILANPKNKNEISRNRFAEWESFEYLHESIMPKESLNFVRDVRVKLTGGSIDLSEVNIKIDEFLGVRK